MDPLKNSPSSSNIKSYQVDMAQPTPARSSFNCQMPEIFSESTCRKRKLFLPQHDPKRFKNGHVVNHKSMISWKNDNTYCKHPIMQLHSGILHGPVLRGRSQNPNSYSTDPYGSGQKKYKMGFTILESIAKANTVQIFLKLTEFNEGFMDMINSPIDRPDVFTLIFQILHKVSQSPFQELKYNFILDLCNTNFVINLRNYLLDLPYTKNKSQNSLYWRDETAFWKNFTAFCNDIVEISPDTAVKKCRALIENVSKTCLDYLYQRHSFVLSEEYTSKLDKLRNKLISHADGNQLINNTNVEGVDNRPAEDFRELSVVPTREDLLDSQPFLRPNIVNGGYSDVEHYLDVQFRLLREDCFGPIRIGINQYLADPHKRKYDHVRVYRNVNFVGPYITNLKIGYLLQIDIKNNHYWKNVNWARSKRLLFGSLVIFTNDRHFNNVIVGSILDRDNTLLTMGKLAISIINSNCVINISNEESYTMIESEVYYEAYCHVLKALQAPSFPKHLAMQQYIVYVNPASAVPSYLSGDKQYIITSKLGVKLKFTVLRPESWPTKEQLHFNDSQYEAYKLALTHEFAVIQGPPGTGKTYVGLNVAKTLLHNIKSEKGCLMLVICYTNHALDQFLEEISKVTKDIIRVGSQSRNKLMEQYNLVNLRRNESARSDSIKNIFRTSKTNLKKAVDDFQEALLLYDILNYGVINCKAFEEEIPEFALICNYYRQRSNVKDPLMHWLFENNAEYHTDFNTCISDSVTHSVEDTEDNEFNNMRKKYNIVLDDHKDKTHLEEIKKLYTSFSLFDAKLALKHRVIEYKKSRKGSNDRYYAKLQIIELNAMINQYNDMIQYRSKELRLYIHETTNFSKITPHDRWCLYYMWIKNKVNEVMNEIKQFQESVSPLVTAYEESRMMIDLDLLMSRRIKVLGMTTSGAARMRKLLQAVSPKIVIVEEAAEVLEQHIITSLTKDCQHLILIGDHQQLRPSVSYLKLAKEYNIEVSLFERMITNGIHSRRLNVQHRMRPEIAALISPHIYPHLENHPSVENFGDVPGLEKNVFFFSHEYQEEVNLYDNNSKANYKEADMVLALANYLMQQGCKSDDVTILTTYSGQMFYMRKERCNYACLSSVKIIVVDNYQGEESKIILLSLVRNNTDNNIGFLGIKNRICVALSRAKQGLYIFGNINMLKRKSELWKKIATTLEDNGCSGTTLRLQCQNHKDQITIVETAKDFLKVPQGGCTRKCNYQYSCGHVCRLSCHGYDREHVQTKCSMKCERVLCKLNHVCPLKCYEDCGACKVLVNKTLPCGHDMMVYCHREPDDPGNKCREEIEDTLPVCKHKVKKQCYEDINKTKCVQKCKQRLDSCGHACELRCCHTSHHSDYVCKKVCNRPKKGCTAVVDCDLGEHICKKKCFEQCEDCNVEVTKVIPDCNHKIKLKCMNEARRALCNEKCLRTLSCGHVCNARCGDPCDISICKQLIVTEGESPCGHKVKLPCNVYASFKAGQIQSKELLKYCNKPCNEDLACKHICGGTCSQCHQGRLHAPCKQTCNQVNICGHQCQEPCNQICPPCSRPCEVQCLHSRCGRMCGQPCVPCREKCNGGCPHGRCTRLCSEACSRAACSAPCARTQACGHRCRGVCGEPCPGLCRVCRPDTFPTDFLGDDYGEDDKFILLQDCNHVLLLEDMDILMMGDRENIQIRQCPFCRKPIINTKRYKDLINKMFKNEINPIKERIYGKNTEINEKMKELRKISSSIYKKCSEGHPDISTALKKFTIFVDSQKKKYLLLVEMLIIYCNIIEMVADCWTAFQKIKTLTLKNEMEANVKMILNALKIDLKSKVPIKISEQQQEDIGNEIKRLNTIVQLAKLIDFSRYSPNEPNVKIQVDAAEKAVLTLSVFNEDKALEALRLLQMTIKSSDIITKMERAMIVKAVGLKAGHWYKCPNGHFYCIGECGGATQIGKCPECGVPIGGTSHTLLPDNSHAPEMDGSAFPAYSEAANNLANFLIDN